MSSAAGTAGFLFVVIPLVLLLLFILNIVTSVWAYRDAISKGRSKEYALLVLIATLIFPVLGFIVYLVIRND